MLLQALSENWVQIILAVVGLVGAMIGIAKIAVKTLSDSTANIQQQNMVLVDKILAQNAAREIAARDIQEKMVVVLDKHLGVIVMNQVRTAEALDLIQGRLLDAIILPMKGSKVKVESESNG